MTASGGTVGALVFTDTATSFAQSSGLTWNASGAAGEGLAITAGTATADVKALSIAQTWNNAAINFVANDTNVTNTASGASSLIERWRVDGTTVASIDKSGYLTLGSSILQLSVGPILNFDHGSTQFSNFTRIHHRGNFLVGGNVSGTTVAESLQFGINRNAWVNYISSGLIGIGSSNSGSYSGSLKLTTLEVAGVTYANRPATPVAGMEVTITDSNTAVWGATVAGGGANNIKARYNGTNWTVVGV